MTSYVFDPRAILYIIPFLVCTLLGAFLLKKKRDEGYVRLFALALFLAALICLSAAMLVCSQDLSTWRLWFGVYIISDVFSVSAFLHFAYVFWEKGIVLKHRRYLAVYILPTIAAISMVLVPDMVIGDSVIGWDASFGAFSPSPDSYLMLFIFVYVPVMLALVFSTFFRMFRQRDDIELRRRSAYFVLSSFVPFITSFALLVYRFMFNTSPGINPVLMTLPISFGIIAYGIVKERLFDIDIIVRKSVLYGMMTSILTLVFFVVQELMEDLVSTTVFAGMHLSNVVSAGFVVLLSIPARSLSQNLTDKLLPNGGRSPPTDNKKNAELYRTELAIAWDDGILTKKERKMLEALRAALDITKEDHERMERDVKSEAGIEEDRDP
ncbi:MAG: histidine kinase N-terminal 7TM domain-containing protein [Candidatus Undinarchaeales archaeon]|jgi:hypothetical protein|nr:histidine kinase N-terminal 7TM domain-containing protein [Candidatus Undinarchaeales archaeon]MDP7492341.1 histidine kinase N-terminal 7TM domain-containing protein [Candidatus Undinarchaeales archaeon]